jgi:predicted GNAT superfamily acetyltransferase
VTPQYNRSPPPLSPLILLEIPSDIQSLKAADPDLALVWSDHIRGLFIDLFARDYLITDFIYQPGFQPRSFYVLSHGKATF